MTPQERDLIQSVFDRLASASATQKDAEAAQFIADQSRRLPDATYGLVQAVVMLEAGLGHAQSRIDDLQRQLEAARGAAPAAGGFTSGPSPWGSVPRSNPLPPNAFPQGVVQPATQPAYAQPQPVYAQPVMAQPASPWAQPASGGGFLRNAATIAAGVAGGALIAEGLNNMFGHHYGGYGYGGGFGGGGFGGNTEVVEQVTVNNYYDQPAPAPDRAIPRDIGGDRASYQDASYDGDSYDDGSYDSGSDDGVDL